MKTDIIPIKTKFLGTKNGFDFEAICVFAAIGFFLDQDTYFKGQQALKPAHTYKVDEYTGKVLEEKPWFQWHYSPRDIKLNQVVNEFSELYEDIIDKQVGNRNIILPLSGGLDSRTQAAALSVLKKKVKSYSYSYPGGHNEALYSKKIAKVCNYPFEHWQIPPGYLWNCIERLASLNECYSEFTQPRSMAFIDRYAALGDVFSLGHWGDVLFDDMRVPDDLPVEDQVKVVIAKIVKKGGIELANALWKFWELDGKFSDYLYERIQKLIQQIDIPDSANARIRAFKSLYWAPRWTSVNLSVFESARPITLPYYDIRMCQFICSVPEKYLAGRQIQIEYLKKRTPDLAKIAWQEHRPFNLYSYHMDRAPWNLPYRVLSKVQRLTQKYTGSNFIERNWELQFIGSENENHLKEFLFATPPFTEFISPALTAHFFKQFKEVNAVYYSHAVSSLLTLSMFSKSNAC